MKLPSIDLNYLKKAILFVLRGDESSLTSLSDIHSQEKSNFEMNMTVFATELTICGSDNLAYLAPYMPSLKETAVEYAEAAWDLNC